MAARIRAVSGNFSCSKLPPRIPAVLRSQTCRWVVCVDAAGRVPQMAPPSAPEVFERSSAQLRVSGGVLDVGMPQPKLQPPGIMAGIGQEVSASVAQHVRVQVG